jgi:hypothetical protein
VLSVSALGLLKSAAAKGTSVTSSGQGIAGATVVREIVRGERVANLIQEVAKRTYVSGGLEHTIISTQAGQSLIVQG